MGKFLAVIFYLQIRMGISPASKILPLHHLVQKCSLTSNSIIQACTI